MLPPGWRCAASATCCPPPSPGWRPRTAVRALAEDYNERVAGLLAPAAVAPPDVVPGLADVEALTARWRDTRPAPQPAPDPDPAPVRPARRWLRRRS